MGKIRRANGKPIGYTTVLYMLGSRTYIGEYNHSGIVIEDGVPSIISKETFDKVRLMIDEETAPIVRLIFDMVRAAKQPKKFTTISKKNPPFHLPFRAFSRKPRLTFCDRLAE